MLGTRGHAELADYEERLRRVLGSEFQLLALDLLTEAAVTGKLTAKAALILVEELCATFVTRQGELDDLLEISRENTGPVNQHVLIIGPRGMGKTMLVRRLAYALEDDPALSALWHPLVLAEEAYTIASAGEFWLEAIRVLSRVRETDKGRWEAIYRTLRTELDEKRLRDMALGKLLEFADEAKRRLLIVAENLNLVFDEQAFKDTGWDRRNTLLNEPRIMLLATATSRFGAIEKPDQALYELFREIRLRPLPKEECRPLWKQITGQDLSLRQIRPLEVLTGGNPRLLAILTSFAAGSSFRELMQDIVVLIDDHTAYFKANVESLAAQERRVFVTLADIWEPAGAKDVARFSRLDVNRTSALLRRLVERGAVTETDRKGRKILNQVAERLYNIYHLLRQSTGEADRARAAVEFMVRFHEPEEVACNIASETCLLDTDERGPLVAAYRHLISRCEADLRNRIIEATPREFLSLSGLDLSGVEGTRLSVPEFGIEGTGHTDDEFSRGFQAVKILMEAAKGEYDEGNFAEALRVLDEIVSGYSGRDQLDIIGQAAKALVNKGYRLGQLGRAEEAIVTCDEVARRFDGFKGVIADLILPGSLLLKGRGLGADGKWNDALETVSHVLDNAPFLQENTSSIIEFFIEAAAVSQERQVLDLLGRFDEAAVKLEPLAVALKILTGQEYRAPQEIEEVAKDVMEEIKSRKAQMTASAESKSRREKNKRTSVPS